MRRVAVLKLPPPYCRLCSCPRTTYVRAVEFLHLDSCEMFATEFLAPHSGCFAVRTARFLVFVQVLLLVIFFGVFGLIFSSMEEEVEVAATVTCSSPIANVSFAWKVGGTFAFGFVMNLLVPISN